MEDRGRDKTLVSVIIPVYNVEAYLPTCLESVCGQSLSRIEILLIDDGSTDASFRICLEWAERDPRIRCFHQENRGVSYARNMGLEQAQAEYIAFVDSDDWLDPAYLEKLYTALVNSGADLAECDLWRCDNRTGKRIYRACYGRMGVPYTQAEHMKYGPTASYKAMSRKSLWIDNDVRFPPCAFESPAVYALLLALSRKTVSVREALYYYRRFRPNSLIETGYAARDGSANNTLGIEAMEHLRREFVSHGLMERWGKVLPGVIIYRLNDILAMQYHRKNPEDFRETVENFRRYLSAAFPEKRQLRYLTWGGYNLNRVLSHLEQLHDPDGRFNFSSLISLAGERASLPPAQHRNRYRQMMLRREQEQSFWTVLEREQPELLVMNLLEERFSILRLGEAFLTESDALEGSDWMEQPPAWETIPFGSEAWTVLWQDSCRAFFRRLRERAPKLRVIMVEDLLCESVGTPEDRRPFPQGEQIRRTNEILRGCYRFAEAQWPGIRIVSPAADALYFTDERYEYGAVPSHVNEIENQQIAARIEALLWEAEGESSDG